VKSPRAWVLLQSGRRLNLLNPSPLDWEDADLAICLSRTNRWGGHSRWERPLSVAQHSLTVLALRQRRDGPLSATDALRELLHDADEGFLGFDPIAPLKPHLGEGYRIISDRLQRAIALRYRLRSWSAEDYAAHKRADRLAAASEAIHVAGWTRAEVRAALKIRLTPLADDPLAPGDGFAPWEPWPPRTAAALFLARLEQLRARQARELAATAVPVERAASPYCLQPELPLAAKRQ
jgi:5'-deoxynucleotidase YfbR-like HD superfamily hydrolase